MKWSGTRAFQLMFLFLYRHCLQLSRVWLLLRSELEILLFFFKKFFEIILNFFRRKFNYLKFCIHRYMRYMPSVLVLMLFIICFVPYMFISGPSINVLNEQVERCQNYWWSTLLMVQNYANVGGSVSTF